MKKFEVYRVEPSVTARIRSEKWLADNVKAGDLVLCFGNLPPLFRLSGHVVVFLQNRYLVENVKLKNFSLKTRLRLGVERFWFNNRISYADEFIVQTPSMKNLLEARLCRNETVRVLPFVAQGTGYKRNISSSNLATARVFDFLYVASGDPHKNHRQLIEAWCLLAKEGLFPSLRLTIDDQQFSELSTWITNKIRQHDLSIVNLGNLSDAQVMDLYRQAGALIFPSTLESFGLPLIEARQASLPVLASELDYVRDLLDPDQSFDPDSSLSIARAVKRFLGIAEEPASLLDAQGFIEQLIRAENEH